VSAARSLVAVALFPATLTGCTALAWIALAAGWSPLIALGAIYPAAVICVVAEWRWPHETAWRPERHAVVTDLLHAVLSQFGAGYVAGLVIQLGAHAWHMHVWPTELPLPAQVGLALLAAELVQYVWHFTFHASPLWRLHMTHHSTSRMYWLAGSRFHPLEVVLVHVSTFGAVVIAGAPAEVLALASVIGMVLGMLQHANVDMRLGPLNWLVAGPELHRWHHAVALTDQRHNYGGVLIVWDIVFRTWFLPASRRLDPGALGLERGTAFPTGYLGQLRSPFASTASAMTAPSRSASTSLHPPGAA
jgi:sterol desaturase/sphingolipid hydroxylase (fatty acid hydroxylase superfamily)